MEVYTAHLAVRISLPLSTLYFNTIAIFQPYQTKNNLLLGLRTEVNLLARLGYR